MLPCGAEAVGRSVARQRAPNSAGLSIPSEECGLRWLYFSLGAQRGRCASVNAVIKRVKVSPADLEGMLGTDEAEIAAQLGDEAAQIPEQAAVEVGFVVFCRKTEKFKRVDVFEKICCLGVQVSQHG